MVGQALGQGAQFAQNWKGGKKGLRVVLAGQMSWNTERREIWKLVQRAFHQGWNAPVSVPSPEWTSVPSTMKNGLWETKWDS